MNQYTTNSAPSKTDGKVGKFNGRNKCKNVKSLKLSVLIFSHTKYLKERKHESSFHHKKKAIKKTGKMI